MPTNIRDPRSIITPDAFEIDERLLGVPLADPWRRLWAMLVDLLVIGILTVFTSSVQLLVWGVVALFFVRIAFQKPGRASQAMAVLLRVFAGCLGLTILAAVVLAFLFLRGGDGPPGPPGLDPDEITRRALEGVEEGAPGPEQIAAGAMAGVEETLAREALRQATAPDEVVEAAVALLEARARRGRTPEDPEEYLEDLEPDEAPWLDDADSLFAMAVERWRAGDAEESAGTGAAAPGEGAGEGEAGDSAVGEEEAPGEAAPVEDEVALLSDAEVLAELSALAGRREDTAAAGEDAGSERAARRESALRRRAAVLVAGDTLDALDRALRRTGEERDDYREDADDLRRALEEEGDSFAALLRDIWDQAGSAIGLWSIYFTVLLTLWKGRTVGKKVMGLRVLRLDGEPMTWWSSFERAGGYVAGIATGLLGFAQVFWDPNRQCIHDKIVGSVVIRDGAQPVAGSWKEAHGMEERR